MSVPRKQKATRQAPRPAGGGAEKLGRPVSLPGRTEEFNDSDGSRKVHVDPEAELSVRVVPRARTGGDARMVLGDWDH
jgi:hypothetical protein